MTYKPPNILDEIILLEQVGQAPTLDVVLCKPVQNVILTADGTVHVNNEISLSPLLPITSSVDIDATVNIGSTLQFTVTGDGAYKPPSLNVEITLLSSVGVRPPFDVVLCNPNNDNSKKVNITIDSDINVSSDIEVDAAIPEPECLTIDGAISVASNLSMVATEFVVGVTIDSAIVIQSEIVATYDSNVFRGAQLDVSSDLQYSKMQGMDKSGGFESGNLVGQSYSDRKESAKLLSIDKQAEFEANVKLTISEQLPTEQSKLIGADSKQLYESQNFVDTKSQLKNENAKLVGQSDWLSFEAMLARQTERKVQGEYSYLDAIMRHNSSEYSRFVTDKLSSLSEFARLPYNVVGYVPPALWQTIILAKQDSSETNKPLDVVMCQPVRMGQRSTITLDNADGFDIKSLIELIIKGDEDSAYGQGVIFVTNSVSLVRSDDGREIKLLGFSVGIDSNSYCWTFSATVPLSELSKVDTALEQRIGVDFTCNGNLWRFILDDCSDSVSFGESSLTIKGKSRAMLLAHPYAQQRGFKFDAGMSARQIAEAELNRNGVASGFTLDWQLAGINGWNVPANTYSYTGKTPINSLQWIAETAGGFINADMSADVLHVLAHYPVPSWKWAAQTPSINLTQSLITSRSRGRVNKPAYNGVTIYGENDNGIGALIKRTGTSGGYQPPMVTSDLMTDTAAAISRGKMILSDTGDIGNIGISMPLVADVGVLKPSTLIGVNDGEQWVGMVRGTTITGRLSSNRALEIDQSIDVERHFDKEIV